jgi:hypothetical protein
MKTEQQRKLMVIINLLLLTQYANWESYPSFSTRVRTSIKENSIVNSSGSRYGKGFSKCASVTIVAPKALLFKSAVPFHSLYPFEALFVNHFQVDFRRQR